MSNDKPTNNIYYGYEILWKFIYYAFEEDINFERNNLYLIIFWNFQII